MSIDLERFPWSDSANRMLTYVTKGWYDKSYVGKWIYEVMGRELDLATMHIEELPYQMFIDTATWGLKYHEIKYGLPVREDLSYEERRRLLREKKNTRSNGMIKILLSKKLGEMRLTQADLARATGIRPNTINELYHELADRVNLEHLDLICEALDCELDELIVRVPNKESAITHTRQGTQKPGRKR